MMCYYSKIQTLTISDVYKGSVSVMIKKCLRELSQNKLYQSLECYTATTEEIVFRMRKYEKGFLFFESLSYTIAEIKRTLIMWRLNQRTEENSVTSSAPNPELNVNVKELEKRTRWNYERIDTPPK